MLAVCRACQFFLPDLIGRQHVRGVLYKSPGRCLLEAPLYSGRAPSGMGSAQPTLAEGSTPAGQTEPRSGYVISEQCPLKGVDAPSAGGSEDLKDLWQGRSRPFHLFAKDNSHCPTYYWHTHDWPNLLLYAFPPIALLPQVVRRIREQGHKVLLVAPLWRNQPWLSELTQLLTAAPWPEPPFFLKGARRLNPPRPLTVPTWDLPTVLRALKGPPFEPLQSTNLRSLSLKTDLLLTLASVKRVGDL